jgi:hypothetical protein
MGEAVSTQQLRRGARSPWAVARAAGFAALVILVSSPGLAQGTAPPAPVPLPAATAKPAPAAAVSPPARPAATPSAVAPQTATEKEKAEAKAKAEATAKARADAKVRAKAQAKAKAKADAEAKEKKSQVPPASNAASKPPSRPKTVSQAPATGAEPARSYPSATPIPDDKVDPAPQHSIGPAGSQISIAEPANVSLSSDLRSRLPSERLVADIQNALGGLQGETVRPSPTGSSAGYVPPGDEEYSFAEGGSQQAIIDRISAGYPDVAGPLVLITVSERGTFVIAAARVFTPDGSGKLKRIARFVIQAADAKPSIIRTDWPACFASAIRRFKNDPDDDSEDPCDTIRGAVSDGAANKPASPQPAAPSPSAAAVQPQASPAIPAPAQPPSAQSPAASAPVQSPSQTQVTSPKGPGLLDDAPAKPGQTTVIAGRDGTAAKTSDPTGPQPTIVAPPSQPLTIVPRAKIPGVVERQAPKTAMLPPVDRAEKYRHYQLVEQILAYGFVYQPRDPRRLSAMVNGMANRDDAVGRCLSKQRTIKPSKVADWLREDLSRDRSDFEKRKRDGEEEYLKADWATDSTSVDSASYCMITYAGPTPLDPFYYTIAEGIFSVAEADARRAKEQERRPGKDWRLPSDIEAFAIATSIIKQRPSAQMTFWTVYGDGQRGMLSIRKDSDTGDREVDHLLESEYQPSRLVPAKAETLILVHN